jgi:hypothetical protein
LCVCLCINVCLCVSNCVFCLIVCLRLIVCLCVSNYMCSRDFINEVSVTEAVSETLVKRLLFHAQCFPSYQLVSSPPSQQLTVMWSLLHFLLCHINQNNSWKFTVIIIILLYENILSMNFHCKISIPL